MLLSSIPAALYLWLAATAQSQATQLQPTQSQPTQTQLTPVLPTGQLADVSTVGVLPASVPILRAKTGHLLVPVTLNGQPAGYFIFDTGAGMSCVDKSLSAKLALPPAGAANAAGNAGTVATTLRKIDSLAFGPVVVKNSLVVELDLAPISAALGHEISGVIGYECFFAGVFEIDSATPTITLHAADAPPIAATGHWQPMTLTSRRPHLPGQVEDHPPGQFLIDLGANTGLTLSSPTVRRFNLLSNRPTTSATSGGVGGTQPAAKGTIRSLKLADQTVTDVPATFSQATQGLLASDENLGAVGVGLLSRYRLFLDYPQSRIALIPK